MKTAISLPDEVFAAAELAARRLGVSRSQLYAQAVAEFLERHRGMGVREALDSVYSTEGSRLDHTLATMQAASLPDEEW
jgi:metal-responsive CopG/Arc/MetJ family transcriptional regulator